MCPCFQEKEHVLLSKKDEYQEGKVIAALCSSDSVQVTAGLFTKLLFDFGQANFISGP